MIVFIMSVRCFVVPYTRGENGKVKNVVEPQTQNQDTCRVDHVDPIHHVQGYGASIPWGQVLGFYLPLAATSMLMMVTHSVVSSAMTRTLAPAIALAGYSAASSVGQMFEAPCYSMQRMALTFIRGRRSFGVVRKTSAIMLAILVGVMLLLSWTPLSRSVFVGIMGIGEEVYGAALPSMRVFILWPISSALRSIYQALIVRQKKTGWLTVNMVVRVCLMFAAAIALPRLWPAGPVGATILMLGLCTEAILAFVVATKAIAPLEEDGPEGDALTSVQVLAFALPLALASAIQTLAKPVVAASLSQTVDPEITLAGYQVASSFSYILLALTYNIYQVVLIFIKDRPTYRQILRFVIALGFTGTAVLAVCNVPVVGNWIFGGVIGTAPDITVKAMGTLAVLAVTPILFALVEFYSGMLTLTKHAGWVTAAKMVNVAATSLTVLTLTRALPGLGGALGALSVVVGGVAEVAVSYIAFRRSKEYQFFVGPDRGAPAEVLKTVGYRGQISS